ncbi:MAG: putative sugar O-methyltransferase [Candidatus Neomarinimicrobiota bacterium]
MIPKQVQRVTSRSNTVHDHNQLLAIARKHYHLANNLATQLNNPQTERWDNYINKIQQAISQFSSTQEAIEFGQRSCGFDHRDNASNQQHLFDLHESTIISEFPEFADCIPAIGESDFSHAETVMEKNGHQVSNVFYGHLHTMLKCLQTTGKPEVVAEIGGGYGSLTRLWFTNPIHAPKSVVLIDFPESLFFAELFLRQNLPKHNFIYLYDPDQKLDLKVSINSIVFCPIENVPALAELEFDLIINTGSMQEFSEEWVDYWMNWLNQTQVKYFYSMNYFAQPLNFMAEGANCWSPRLSEQWTIIYQRANPTLIRQQSDRHFAEIVARKSPADLTGWQRQWKILKSRIIDDQILLEYMDMIRMNPDETLIWDLITRTDRELYSPPKESLWLVDYLRAQGSSEFLKLHGVKLEQIAGRLQQIRAGGRESIWQ